MTRFSAQLPLLALAAVATLGATVVPAIAAPADPRPAMTRTDLETRLKTRFAKLDADRNGSVSQAEIDAHRSAKKAERQAKRGERRTALFATLDTDRNGTLSREEFTAPRPDASKRDGKRHWRGAGRMGGRGGAMLMQADANKDGQLTYAELSARAIARFDAADANRDGIVTAEERKAARAAMRARPAG